MSLANKILMTVFILLLIITAGEIGFYFFFIPKLDKVEAYLTVFPTVGPDNVKKYKLYHSMLDKGIITSSIRSDRIESTLATIDTKEGIFNNFKYKIKLTIKVGDSETNDYYFNEEEISRAKIVKSIDGKEQPISLNDLKPGDKIVMEIKTDLIKEPNSSLVDLTITKIL